MNFEEVNKEKARGTKVSMLANAWVRLAWSMPSIQGEGGGEYGLGEKNKKVPINENAEIMYLKI